MKMFIPSLRVAAVLLLFAVALSALSFALFSTIRVNAQGEIPSARFVIFEGLVRVAGDPAPEGLRVFVSVAGQPISENLSVEVDANGNFDFLKLDLRANVEGEDVVFKLADGTAGIIAQESVAIASNFVVISRTDKASTLYTYLDPSTGEPRPEAWTLGQVRRVILDFPALPVPTPTPTPVPLGAEFFSGTARAANFPAGLPDGTGIYAIVGTDYISNTSPVQSGQFLLIVDPGSTEYLGQEIEFYVGDVKATQTSQFQGGNVENVLNLLFPPIVVVEPTPTPLPPTPTPTPTPTPQVAPTPTPMPDPPAPEGGGCTLFSSGGAISLGTLGMIALPGLFVFRRLLPSFRSGRQIP